ncbi:hypothetical protein C8A03DRAFT_29227 [Achaetomium macrosporum]|uniref:Pheromone receptor n=1 Tax=Achaetomium macrosporum TaxID=79813 RepID=A0AAN7CID1_9PEZI|nr:hypothetical protein C8A03DRAFT_29227 [Achaetomium macrosporum]
MASTNSTQRFNKWALFGFTTTSEERIGPGPPYTYPTLQVNLFFRVFLGIVSFFVTWVPARLLWRNGEFGGTVLCVMLLVVNLQTVINALIWRNDNVETWWAGYGWCDIQAYSNFALHTAFNVSLFEIMRGLATKVVLNRAVKLSRSERRRQRIVSALVIFTFPVIQVLVNYFATFDRYNISTLVGCGAVYYPNWIFLVFYILPTPVFAVGAAYMAGLTFYRYRKIDKATRDVARSQDGVAAARQERVRKKLYFMTLFCIIVVLPLIMVLLSRNIVEGAPWNLPYDLYALHFGTDPFNIYFISFTTSDMMNFPSLASSFIAELAGIAVFIPFGTTPEALNMYRELLLACGLGYIFPKLREEYVPRPKRGSSLWSSFTRSLRGKGLLASTSTTSNRKDSLLPTAEQISLTSRPARTRSSSVTQPRNVAMDMGPIQYPEKTATVSSVAHHNPWPDLSATELDAATAQIEAGPPARARNPFPFPTLVSITTPPVRFPSLSIPFHSRNTNKNKQPLPAINDASTPSLSLSASSRGNQTIQTQAQAHARLAPSASSTTAATVTPPKPLTVAHPSPWAVPAAGSSSRAVGVDTRVWAANEDHGHPRSSNSSSMSPLSAQQLQPEPDTTSKGVRVETSIAQRSMDMDLDIEHQADGSAVPARLRVDRASSAAS